MPTNTSRLKARIIEMKMTQEQLAAMLNISYQSLSYKINNKTDFKASEILKLCELLKIEDKDQYFFCSENSHNG